MARVGSSIEGHRAIAQWKIFNIFTGKVAIIKTRITRFLTILRPPKITRGQLPPVNFGALRKRNYRVKGRIIIRFLPINQFILIFNDF